MGDLIDRIVTESDTTDSEQDARKLAKDHPGSDTWDGEVDTKDPQVRKLVAQKALWRQRYDEQKNTLDELRNTVAELKGHMQGVQGNGNARSRAPSSFSEMDEQQLSDAFSLGAYDPNQERMPNPEAQRLAMQEMMRREMREYGEKVRKEAVQETAHTQWRDQVFSQVGRDYGDQHGALDESSPLWQVAMTTISGAQKRYGKDIADRHPEVAQGAFDRAYITTYVPQLKERLRTLEQENARFRQREQMEQGGAIGGARVSADVTQALEKNDIKSAIRNLQTVRSFETRPGR